MMEQGAQSPRVVEDDLQRLGGIVLGTKREMCAWYVKKGIQKLVSRKHVNFGQRVVGFNRHPSHERLRQLMRLATESGSRGSIVTCGLGEQTLA